MPLWVEGKYNFINILFKLKGEKFAKNLKSDTGNVIWSKLVASQVN